MCDSAGVCVLDSMVYREDAGGRERWGRVWHRGRKERRRRSAILVLLSLSLAFLLSILSRASSGLTEERKRMYDGTQSRRTWDARGHSEVSGRRRGHGRSEAFPEAEANETSVAFRRRVGCGRCCTAAADDAPELLVVQARLGIGMPAAGHWQAGQPRSRLGRCRPAWTHRGGA